MSRFTGKVAVVFASSRGIGRAVAERIGREGASVVVNYMTNAAKAEEVVNTIKAAGGQAIAMQGTVASSKDVNHIYETAISTFGKIDIVINAAGQSVFKPIADLTDADFEQVFSVNAKGAMYVLSGAAKHVADNGRIIQFSTGGTKMTMPGTGLYSASKAAGEMIALNLAKELGHRGITANVVSPGATDTDGLVMPKEQIGQIVAMTPLGRLGTVSDVADAVTFIASDDGRWVTGQNIQINGGIL